MRFRTKMKSSQETNTLLKLTVEFLCVIAIGRWFSNFSAIAISDLSTYVTLLALEKTRMLESLERRDDREWNDVTGQ